MKKSPLIIAFLAFTSIAYCQPNHPKDQNNYALLKVQEATTEKFMAFLEHKKPDSAITLLDPSFVLEHKGYNDTLQKYSKELQKYLATTKLSIVTIFLEDDYNTYRCRYWNADGEYFYIDLYLKTGTPGSLIFKVDKVPASQLARERRELAKQRRQINNDIKVPPPPPPSLPNPKSGKGN